MAHLLRMPVHMACQTHTSLLDFCGDALELGGYRSLGLGISNMSNSMMCLLLYFPVVIQYHPEHPGVTPVTR